MSTTISNPVSSTNLNPGSAVSDLENALMNSIGQEMQSGQNTSSAALQQEMQLLTELLNQSTSDSGSSSSPANDSTPSASRSDPSTGNGTSVSNNGIDRTERKLDKSLERNVTERLQNGETPSNGNALQQEMDVLIDLLGQGG